MSSPMHILFASDVLPDPNSGAAGTDWQTIEALRRLGHHVDAVWATDLPHRIRHGNLHYLLELPRAYRNAIGARCDRADYDLIHVDQPYAWMAARDHRQRRRPGVFLNRSHGWEPAVAAALKPWRQRYGEPEWRFPRGLLGRPVRWVLHRLYPHRVVRYADGVIVSCSADREYILRHEPRARAQVACIPQAPPEAFLRQPSLPLTPGRIRRILHVGQHAFFKGSPLLIEVFNRLASSAQNLDLTWCCAEASHPAIRSALSGPAREAVHLVPWMPQDRLIELYDAHGLFLFPSFYEGFGKAFLEAMSRGLCVVASDTGGMHDVIADGRDGRLVPVGDVEGFVATVRAMVADPAVAAAAGRAAAATASEYTWERVARETVGFGLGLQTREARRRA